MSYSYWARRILKDSNRKQAARLGFIAGLKAARAQCTEIRDEKDKARMREILDLMIQKEGGSSWAKPTLP